MSGSVSLDWSPPPPRDHCLFLYCILNHYPVRLSSVAPAELVNVLLSNKKYNIPVCIIPAGKRRVTYSDSRGNARTLGFSIQHLC